MDPVQAQRGQAVVPQSTLDPPEPRQPIYIEDYEIIRLLGKGSFGSVYIVRSRRDPTKMCVMKKISVHNLSEWPLATDGLVMPSPPPAPQALFLRAPCPGRSGSRARLSWSVPSPRSW
jgi:hypothetical protein